MLQKTANIMQKFPLASPCLLNYYSDHTALAEKIGRQSAALISYLTFDLTFDLTFYLTFYLTSRHLLIRAAHSHRCHLLSLRPGGHTHQLPTHVGEHPSLRELGVAPGTEDQGGLPLR